jgi:hypothetical protein
MLSIHQLKATYSNEQVVLILFSRLYFNTCEKQVVEDFIARQDIEWGLVYKIARVHGIRSFIYSVIVKYDVAVKSEFISILKKHYNEVKFKNFSQLKVTTGLITEFKTRNINLIPYKGALFAVAYYNDWAARESSDIDFLIAEKDLEVIEDYFIINGYQPLTNVPKPYLKYYRKLFKDIVYRHKGINTSVEMHWRLMERFSGSYPVYDFFIPHLSPFQSGDFSLHKLTPTYDFLAVASNHFMKDMYIKFKYMIDIACIISKETAGLDTETIFLCAKKFSFEKRLRTGLELVDQLLGVKFNFDEPYKIPVELLKVPLRAKLYLPRLYINEPKFIKYTLPLQDNFIGQVKFLSRCLFYFFMPTYADINQLKLPGYFLPLLILLRPFRLLYEAVRKRPIKAANL